MMQRTRVILAVVCLFAVAFGGGAATYAQLSDTESATVSAAAGKFDLCRAGETVTYEFSRASDSLEHVDGPDIVTFSSYNYERNVIFVPVAVNQVDIDSAEPIRRANFRLRSGGTRAQTYDPPITQKRIGRNTLIGNSFTEVTFTCAADNTTQSASAPGSASASSAPNTSAAVVESSAATETTSETSEQTTDIGTETPEIDTPTATPTETATTTPISVTESAEKSSTTATTPTETTAEPTSSTTETVTETVATETQTPIPTTTPSATPIPAVTRTTVEPTSTPPETTTSTAEPTQTTNTTSTVNNETES